MPPHWMENLPNERLAHLVRDAARGLNRSLQARLATHGVAFGHWVFLRMLWEGDGLTQREMSVDEFIAEQPYLVAADLAVNSPLRVRAADRRACRGDDDRCFHKGASGMGNGE